MNDEPISIPIERSRRIILPSFSPKPGKDFDLYAFSPSEWEKKFDAFDQAKKIIVCDL